MQANPVERPFIVTVALYDDAVGIMECGLTVEWANSGEQAEASVTKQLREQYGCAERLAPGTGAWNGYFYCCGAIDLAEAADANNRGVRWFGYINLNEPEDEDGAPADLSVCAREGSAP